MTNADPSTHSHPDITYAQLNRIKKMLRVNCLHKGHIEQTKGKRYVVAIDGSEASRRAWEAVNKLIGPDDHLLVVTVWESTVPVRCALEPEEELQLKFEMWRSARHILQQYLDELASSSHLVSIINDNSMSIRN